MKNRSRREFLGAAVGAALVGSEWLWSEEVDPRVAQIVSKTIAVDMHNHLRIPFVKEGAAAQPDPDFDISGEMKRSGLSAVVETYNLDGMLPKQPGEYYRYQRQALAFEDRLLAKNHMRRALNLKDLEKAHAQREPIIIQSAEGAQFLEGRLERLEEAYRRGMRTIQPVHEQDDPVSPVGDVYTAPAHLGGLTAFGTRVIKECNRLGIVVDMTHASWDTLKAALKVATEPMLYSHAGLKPEGKQMTADMERRMLTKDAVRAVADSGGVVGIWWREANSVNDYVGLMKAMVDVAGEDHVGIGTDSDLTSLPGTGALPFTNEIWKDESGGFFYAVAGEMLKQGFSAEAVGKIGGGNFCRVFGRVTQRRV